MESVVCNTIQFRFPVGASPPSWVEIAEFTKRLNSDLMLMDAVYKYPRDRSLCIKFKSKEAMEETLRENGEMQKFRYSNGKIVDVHMCTAGLNIAYVRVFDLPPEIPDNTLALALGAFGKVGSIVREKFPAGMGLDHLHTGVRGVYVDIVKEIPPSVEIGSWKARIFYDGLKDKCFACNQEGHRRDSCPQRKTRKQVEKNQAPVTYAGVVESGATGLPAEVVVVEEETGGADEEEIEAVEDISVVYEEQAVKEGAVQQRTKEEEEEAEQRKLRLELERERRRELINMVKNGGASERRAQFAASGSTEMLRPKKAARKSSK